jgi:hypothetical protein
MHIPGCSQAGTGIVKTASDTLPNTVSKTVVCDTWRGTVGTWIAFRYSYNTIWLTERYGFITPETLRLHAVLAIVGITAVLEAGGKATGQTDDVVGGTEQPRTGIGGDPSAIKRRNDRAALNGCKFKQIWATLCRHRGPPLLSGKALLQKNFRRSGGPMHLPLVRDTG